MKNGKSLIIISVVVFLFILSSCQGNDIPAARIDSFSEVRTIQVLVDQSYVDDAGNEISDFSLPVYDDCKVILENIGFSVISETGNDCNSILEIKINGTALCDYYHHNDTNTKMLLYTGAELDGSILFTVNNIDSVEKKFFEVREPPVGTVFKPVAPSDAPFDRLGWQKYLFLLLSDIWGVDVLSRSLTVQGIFLKEQVIAALAETKDSSSVDILINMLENEDFEYYSETIAEALGKKGDKSAVAVLIDVLINDDYPLNRKAAAEALGEIGDKSALDALSQVLEEEEDEDIREACIKAINKISGESK